MLYCRFVHLFVESRFRYVPLAERLWHRISVWHSLWHILPKSCQALRFSSTLTHNKVNGTYCCLGLCRKFFIWLCKQGACKSSEVQIILFGRLLSHLSRWRVACVWASYAYSVYSDVVQDQNSFNTRSCRLRDYCAGCLKAQDCFFVHLTML
jgi:hypothetical protein